MSHSAKPSSSSVSCGGNWRRRRGAKERGIPKKFWCGEETMIKTSGTAKNPGRLFHCCPHGSEGDKFHLFTWTDECVVEEIEDLKSMMCDVKGEKSDLRVEVVELQKELERIKLTLERDKNYCCCFL
ncbi:hypothetical protein Bca52824_074483 [Brassica carinata]|uniref:GRF-type domain-containing protein n=1 Tax=Brassica carinata TaxID=52824 RepID=A0A8X7PT70_BRACI|nr:PREDICTED: uncharacterized protein At4g04775-like [Brassica oleracea var. oleracea]KAG2255189.1 hypothetical protein Bca52824_074483 [Brassica carinata]